MIDNFEDARSDLLRQLRAHRLEMTPTAMGPLRAIDFSRLVHIVDHEEAFLVKTFVESLKDAHKTRQSTTGGSLKVNRQDVQTALLMLGTAVTHANERSISSATKEKVRSICPYCVD